MILRKASRKFPIAGLLAVSLMLAMTQSATATTDHVVKPQRPAAMKAWKNVILRAGNSSFPAIIETLTGLTHTFNLLYTVGTPATLIIPADNLQIPLAEQSDKKLTALTANLILFPPPFFTNQFTRIDEFEKLARSLSPDVIFLQEVWDNASLHYLIKRFSDYHAVLMPHSLFNLSGLLILSRYKPLRATAEVFPLSYRHNPEELLARKGMLLVEISFADQSVWLVNTHLYSAPSEAAFRANPGQFQHLISRMKELPSIIVAGGDMNLQPAELEPMLSGGIVRDDCNLPTAGLPPRAKKLDYLLAKGNKTIAVEVLASRAEWPIRFSDHHAVFAEIRLNQRP